MVNLGVSLPGVNINAGVNLIPSANQPQQVQPQPNAGNQMAVVANFQTLVPSYDVNGIVTAWVLRTINYNDNDLSNIPSLPAPKSLVRIAPWKYPSFNVVSTP